MPAGMGVVADVGKAAGGERLLDDGENGVAGFGRDPGVDAVGDDVIERVCGRVIIVDGEAVKLDISSSDGDGDGVGAMDMGGAVIDACETAAGDGWLIASRLKPVPQPSSRTRQFSTAGGARPLSEARAAMIPGWESWKVRSP